MAINIKPVADFWLKVFGDVATTGDGSNDTAPARFDQFNSDIGGTSDAEATSNTGTFTLIQLFKRLLNSRLPHPPIMIATGTLTRPANTTQYTAGDALSDSATAPSLLSVPNIARVNGGSGTIVDAFCSTSQTAMAGVLKGYLYNNSPTAINDNAAFTLLTANNANLQAVMEFGSFTTEGTGSNTAIARATFAQGRYPVFVCDAGSRNLNMLISVPVAFTPASGQTFNFYFLVRQD